MAVEARIHYPSYGGYGSDAIQMMAGAYAGERTCYDGWNGHHQNHATFCPTAPPPNFWGSHGFGNAGFRDATMHNGSEWIGYREQPANLHSWLIVRYEYTAATGLWEMRVWQTNDTPSNPGQPYQDTLPTGVWTMTRSLRPTSIRIGHPIYFTGIQNWWGPGTWTQPEVDYIRVWTWDTATPTPTPTPTATPAPSSLRVRARDTHGAPVVVPHLGGWRELWYGQVQTFALCSNCSQLTAPSPANLDDIISWGGFISFGDGWTLVEVQASPGADLSYPGAGANSSYDGWTSPWVGGDYDIVYVLESRATPTPIPTPTSTQTPIPTQTATPTPSPTPTATPAAALELVVQDRHGQLQTVDQIQRWTYGGYVQLCVSCVSALTHATSTERSLGMVASPASDQVVLGVTPSAPGGSALGSSGWQWPLRWWGLRRIDVIVATVTPSPSPSPTPTPQATPTPTPTPGGYHIQIPMGSVFVHVYEPGMTVAERHDYPTDMPVALEIQRWAGLAPIFHTDAGAQVQMCRVDGTCYKGELMTTHFEVSQVRNVTGATPVFDYSGEMTVQYQRPHSLGDTNYDVDEHMWLLVLSQGGAMPSLPEASVRIVAPRGVPGTYRVDGVLALRATWFEPFPFTYEWTLPVSFYAAVKAPYPQVH